MSSPFSRTSPAIFAEGIVSCMRLRIRMNVDLPHPEGPINAVTVACGIGSDTRSSTFFEPNHEEMLTASKCAWSPVFDNVVPPWGGAAVTKALLLRLDLPVKLPEGPSFGPLTRRIR